MNELTNFLSSQEIKYQRNKKLSECTSIGIGGIAKLIIRPKSKQEFTNVVLYLARNGFEYRVVGNMTNLLPSDAAIETILVSTLSMNNIHILEGTATAESGALFSKLILNAAKESFGGAEALFAIPGTVGAMLSINAGAYGASISDFLSEVTVCDLFDGEQIKLKKDDVAFYYRDSELKRQKLVVLEAKFSFSNCEKQEIYKNISDIKQIRARSQPIGLKTLGSVFKRGDGYAASYLIDQCGLKGERIGNISVSEKHAGFFVNEGNGTARDFLALVDLVKNKVKEKYGIELEEEFELLK